MTGDHRQWTGSDTGDTGDGSAGSGRPLPATSAAIPATGTDHGPDYRREPATGRLYRRESRD
jgi:hypothetical protein